MLAKRLFVFTYFYIYSSVNNDQKSWEGITLIDMSSFMICIPSWLVINYTSSFVTRPSNSQN